MFRNVFRSTRCLARREINTFTPVLSNFLVKVQVRNCEKVFITPKTYYSSNKELHLVDVDPVVFEEYCSETLESLSDYFEELIEQSSNFKGADVIFSDGVLTVDLGKEYGTYVINRQTPNKQIWLSSPTTGPKRYDLVLDKGGYWVYKHDGVTLHKLLQDEISKLSNSNVDFSKCAHSFL